MKGSRVREASRLQVLAALVSAGRSTRTGLVQQTGLSKATISRLIDQLVKEAIVREAEPVQATGRGPRQTAIELVAEGTPICGIDLGATNARFTLTDLSGRVLRVQREQTPRDLDSIALAKWLVDQVKGLSKKFSAHTQPWATVVGVPGVVHPRTGAIRGAPNLPAIEGDAFTKALTSRLRGTTAFDNDANLALLGELHFGAARGARSAVMFTIGTGVGAGVALDGKLYRGPTGFAGELGYLIIRPDLTLEEAVAGPGLLEQGRRFGLKANSPSELLQHASSPRFDHLRQHLEAAYLTAFSAAICAFEPEVIVVGGGLAAFVEPLRERLRSQLAARLPYAPPIVISELGDLAGTCGALVVGLERAYGRLGLHFEDLNGVSAIAKLAAIAPGIRDL